jgi:hypothetical protein
MSASCGLGAAADRKPSLLKRRIFSGRSERTRRERRNPTEKASDLADVLADHLAGARLVHRVGITTPPA